MPSSGTLSRLSSGLSPRTKGVDQMSTSEVMRAELQTFMDGTLRKALTELETRVLKEFKREFSREGVDSEDIYDQRLLMMEEKDISSFDHDMGGRDESLKRISKLGRPFLNRHIRMNPRRSQLEEKTRDRATRKLPAGGLSRQELSPRSRTSTSATYAVWRGEDMEDAPKEGAGFAESDSQPSRLSFAPNPLPQGSRLSCGVLAPLPKGAPTRGSMRMSLKNLGDDMDEPMEPKLVPSEPKFMGAIPETEEKDSELLSPEHMRGSRVTFRTSMATGASRSPAGTDVMPLEMALMTREKSWKYYEENILSERQGLLNFGDEVSPADDDADAYMAYISRPPGHRRGPLYRARTGVRDLVQSPCFERLTGLLVLVNAVALGVETDYQASFQDAQASRADDGFLAYLLWSSEILFTVLFSIELTLRMFAYRGDFFFGEHLCWNIFDSVVVGMQVMEQVVNLVVWSHIRLNYSFLRLLRVLRLIRITRLVRIVRYVEELHTIVSSITSSMMALFWTLSLLMMVIYIFSVFFTQVVLDVHQTKNSEHLEYWYGRLPRTILTMFEVIVGGVSWDEVVVPLIEDISPWMGVVLCLYISFCVFAMMNMATGVFVERATRKAQEDKDTYTANHISDLFFSDPNVNKDEVTWEVFCKKMDSPDMQEYFKAINVDPSEAKGLFQLLDADDSGTINGEELVNGCLRLRGGAKALELSLLMHETSRMHSKMLAHWSKVETSLGHITKVVEGTTGRVSQSARKSLRQGEVVRLVRRDEESSGSDPAAQEGI